VTRTIILEVDENDYDIIQKYFSDFQMSSAKIHALSGKGETGSILPKGESNLAGVLVAECVRSLFEYLDLWNLEHPK
jgi:hypothetical protein